MRLCGYWKCKKPFEPLSDEDRWCSDVCAETEGSELTRSMNDHAESSGRRDAHDERDARNLEVTPFEERERPEGGTCHVCGTHLDDGNGGFWAFTTAALWAGDAAGLAGGGFLYIPAGLAGAPGWFRYNSATGLLEPV